MVMKRRYWKYEILIYWAKDSGEFRIESLEFRVESCSG
jgi:hypothetical protein